MFQLHASRPFKGVKECSVLPWNNWEVFKQRKKWELQAAPIMGRGFALLGNVLIFAYIC